MLKVTIEIAGKTLSDVTDAIAEAKRKIAEGFTSGMDRNEDGQYSFDVSGNEEDE